jgi:hypothetical protein
LEKTGTFARSDACDAGTFTSSATKVSGAFTSSVTNVDGTFKSSDACLTGTFTSSATNGNGTFTSSATGNAATFASSAMSKVRMLYCLSVLRLSWDAFRAVACVCIAIGRSNSSSNVTQRAGRVRSISFHCIRTVLGLGLLASTAIHSASALGQLPTGWKAHDWDRQRPEIVTPGASNLPTLKQKRNAPGWIPCVT